MRAPGEETTIRNLYHKKLSFKQYNKKLVLNKFSSIGGPPADILPPNKSDYSYVISTQNLDFLQSHVKEVIVGSLLGDGCIISPKKGNKYFRFKQSIIHTEYLFFIYFILEPWCTKGSPIFAMYKDKRYNKYYGNLTLLTRAEVSVRDHLNIDKLYTLFYKSNGTDIIKEIPKNIGELLTDGDSFVYMDSG